MKENTYFRNTALAVVLCIALAGCRLIRTFVPMAVLPELDIPNMMLISLAALLLDHYLAKGIRRFDFLLALTSALTFGLLPFAAGFAEPMEALKLAVAGGIVFAFATWLFTEIQDRLSTGPAAKAAPIFSALGLYLAAQCFAGFL